MRETSTADRSGTSSEPRSRAGSGADGAHARRAVLLFTKPAVPGRVKTRLHPAVGPEGAAALHRAFLSDTLGALRGGPWNLRLLWALEDGEQPPVVESTGWRRQEGRDLGERLERALRDAAAEHEAVAAVGSDHPELEAGAVEEAFRRLERGRLERGRREPAADVVLGPVADGGYFLVALRSSLFESEVAGAESPAAALFRDVPWSTAEVLTTTLERAAERGLRVEQLTPGRDVDRPDDLEALVARLAADPAGAACPATRALLRRWGRLETVRASASRSTVCEETRR